MADGVSSARPVGAGVASVKAATVDWQLASFWRWHRKQGKGSTPPRKRGVPQERSFEAIAVGRNGGRG